MKTLRHKFVKYIPSELEEGVLYVSFKFGTVIHLCCCGCGFEVVTPITPTDWTLRYNGESISLEPSIGNWDFKCQSHYYITNSTVVWSRRYSESEIESVKIKDQKDKVNYYGEDNKNLRVSKPTKILNKRNMSFLNRLISLFRKKE